MLGSVRAAVWVTLASALVVLGRARVHAAALGRAHVRARCLLGRACVCAAALGRARVRVRRLLGPSRAPPPWAGLLAPALVRCRLGRRLCPRAGPSAPPASAWATVRPSAWAAGPVRAGLLGQALCRRLFEL